MKITKQLFAVLMLVTMSSTGLAAAKKDTAKNRTAFYVKAGGLAGASFLGVSQLTGTSNLVSNVYGGIGVERVQGKYYGAIEASYLSFLGSNYNGKLLWAVGDEMVPQDVTQFTHGHVAQLKLMGGFVFNKDRMPVKVYALVSGNAGKMFTRNTSDTTFTTDNGITAGVAGGVGFGVQVAKHLEIGAELPLGYQAIRSGVDVNVMTFNPSIFVKVLL